MAEMDDRKRAEGWAIKHLGRMYVSEVVRYVERADADEIEAEMQTKNVGVVLSG